MIAINAICSAYAFNHMFNNFHQRCVFYADPVFALRNIQYHPHDVKTIENDNTTSTISENNEVVTELEEEITEEETIRGLNFKDPEVPDIEVKDGRYWVNNETLTAQIIVDLRRTIFTDVVLCDWVLFIPLMTFVVAVFLGALILIFERGGKGYTTDM